MSHFHGRVRRSFLALAGLWAVAGSPPLTSCDEGDGASPESIDDLSAGSAGASSPAETPAAGAGDGGIDVDRRDPPPGGLGEQFGRYEGGNPWDCETETGGLDPLPPYFVASDGVVGATVLLCGEGFESDQEIELTVVEPTGSYQSLVVERFDSRVEATFFPVPGSPLGEYEVVASQADLVTNSSFVLSPATAPRVVVSTGQRAPDRTAAMLALSSQRSAQVFVVGEPAGTAIRLFLFAVAPNGDRVFSQELPSVTADPRGEATLELTFEAAATPGTYCVAAYEQVNELGPGEVTNDPCYRPGGLRQELVVSQG